MNARPNALLNLLRRRAGQSLSLGLLTASLLGTHSVLALDNGLALTPPMGWNSWNKFGTNVSEALIQGIADAMATNGLREAGYEYINIDDGWQVKRDTNGIIVADPQRFPGGIQALADYVHSRGLKLGIYSDRGTQTCGGRPGSQGHEVQDATTYAAWGIDYLKYDNCNAAAGTQQADYERMRDALLNSGGPIVYSICAWQFQSWMPACGNLWRTTMDIRDNWSSVVSILDANASLAASAGPGHWNDPDMLEVGNGGMSTTEYTAHFTMWCLMAAPLILGNDVRSMSDSVRSIITNAEVIAVDQDAAGLQGTRVSKSGNLEIWCKSLASTNATTKAVALLNRGAVATNIVVTWSTIGVSDYATVRDLWAHQDLGWAKDSFGALVPAHGVVLLRISTGNPPRLTMLEANPAVRLRAYGVRDTRLVVQSSTDLSNWMPIATNTPSSDAWDYAPPSVPGPQQYYRLLLP